MTTILITGASGSIGKEILEFFSNNNNYKIFALINDNVNLKKSKNIVFINCRIEELINLNFNFPRIDYIFHLAFPNSNKNLSKILINKEINKNKLFLKFINKISVKNIIYFSTAKIAIIKDKKNKNNINNFSYEICKYQIENIFRKDLNQKNKLIILRIGVVFGLKNKSNFNLLVDYIKKYKFLPTRKKKIYKNLIYIKNLNNCLENIVKSKNHRDMYFLYDSNIDLNNLIDIISKKSNKKIIKIFIPNFFYNILKFFNIDRRLFKSFFDSFYIDEISYNDMIGSKTNDKNFIKNMNEHINNYAKYN